VLGLSGTNRSGLNGGHCMRQRPVLGLSGGCLRGHISSGVGRLCSQGCDGSLDHRRPRGPRNSCCGIRCSGGTWLCRQGAVSKRAREDTRALLSGGAALRLELQLHEKPGPHLAIHRWRRWLLLTLLQHCDGAHRGGQMLRRGLLVLRRSLLVLRGGMAVLLR
jgi:hypothetical protein